MKKTNATLLIINCIFLFIACKKDKPTIENNEGKKTTKELLVEKNWYLIGATISPAFFGTENLYDSLAPCGKDDIINYNSNGNMYTDYGNLKCSKNEPQIDSNSYWELNNDTLVITVKNNGQTQKSSLIINSIDDKNMSSIFYQKLDTTTYKFIYKYETH